MLKGIAHNREDGGQLVRDAWIYWASKQRNPKSSWLLPWHQMEESDREADRVIWDEVVSPYATMCAQLVEERNRLQDTVSHLMKSREALDEIGTAAASALDEENIRDWGDGGSLGDVLIGIKDIVATIYADEKRSRDARD